MLTKKTLTTGKTVITHHVEAEDVYALARKLGTGPFRLFSMAYDAYACSKCILVNDYSSFRANGIIPQYLQSYVIVHYKDEVEK